MLNVGKKCGKEGSKNVKKMSPNIMVSVETVSYAATIWKTCPFLELKRVSG